MSSLLKITEAVSLGMHVMAVLASEPKRLLSVREAATAMDVSEAHLAKVMQRLARARLVQGVRGPRGGFLLARSADEIVLLEIYEAIEGPVVVRHCLFSTRLCDGKKCIFGGLLTEVDMQAKEHLAATKLAQIADVVQGLLKEDANA